MEVVDAAGTAVRDATVTATNVGTGHTITSITGERGVTTAVNEDIGEGTVRLTATAGSKVSAPSEVTWTCDGCHCHPEPDEVKLQLHP
ncbi:carboxypeptidase regulatory-like domain-containing protein [Vitiosangium sp. GDMCC 1.1324]|nr:carboxypeptidase regulatory-like domain-containing protein [Vitiosangium sp. GDMCC 1.1324]